MEENLKSEIVIEPGRKVSLHIAGVKGIVEGKWVKDEGGFIVIETDVKVPTGPEPGNFITYPGVAHINKMSIINVHEHCPEKLVVPDPNMTKKILKN